MLKGSETSSVWIALKKEFKKNRWDHIRLENKVSLGLPDVNVHVPGVGDVWMELKFVREVDDQVNLGLRKEQYNWMVSAHKAGRRVLLIAKAGGIWYCWSTPLAWLMAKSLSDWQELAQLGEAASGPKDLLTRLTVRQ